MAARNGTRKMESSYLETRCLRRRDVDCPFIRVIDDEWFPYITAECVGALALAARGVSRSQPVRIISICIVERVLILRRMFLRRDDENRESEKKHFPLNQPLRRKKNKIGINHMG